MHFVRRSAKWENIKDGKKEKKNGKKSPIHGTNPWQTGFILKRSECRMDANRRFLRKENIFMLAMDHKFLQTDFIPIEFQFVKFVLIFFLPSQILVRKLLHGFQTVKNLCFFLACIQLSIFKMQWSYWNEFFHKPLTKTPS